ncbi:hypothetical protein J6590_055052 [Homalodisca vitripennis]|nr:hypothetical protein J6590_055052 [Homalodisca vitripennis]
MAVISDEEQDLDTPIMLRVLQTLLPEIEARDVSEWDATADVDCPTEEELTDEKIIETVMQADDQEKDDVDDEDVQPTTRESHAEAKNAFDLAIQCIGVVQCLPQWTFCGSENGGILLCSRDYRLLSKRTLRNSLD